MEEDLKNYEFQEDDFTLAYDENEKLTLFGEEYIVTSESIINVPMLAPFTITALEPSDVYKSIFSDKNILIIYMRIPIIIFWLIIKLNQ